MLDRMIDSTYNSSNIYEFIDGNKNNKLIIDAIKIIKIIQVKIYVTSL
jgi:hypothetical protein